MNNYELYRQKHQAHFDEWKADIAKLRAKASGASAEAQIAINKQVATLDRKLENYQAKLAELADSNEEAWGRVKDGVETTWASMKSALAEAASKFKN